MLSLVAFGVVGAAVVVGAGVAAVVGYVRAVAPALCAVTTTWWLLRGTGIRPGSIPWPVAVAVLLRAGTRLQPHHLAGLRAGTVAARAGRPVWKACRR